MNKVCVFLFDGFSDWEISYLSTEINNSDKFELLYFSLNGKPVISMGGLQVTPAASLADIDINEIKMLILPGGTEWEKGGNSEIEKLTLELFNGGKPVAAICAATTFLGRLGVLDKIKHTSNDINYLKAVATDYKGEEHYQNTLAMSENRVITANGIAPIEFAREIFKTIDLYPEERIEKWFQLFKNGVWSELV